MGLKLGIVSYDGSPPQGGQGVYVSQIARRLPRHDVDPLLLCPNPGDNGWAIPLGGGNPLSFSYRASRMLPALVRRHRVDVVHAQGGPGGVLLLRSPGAPLVYTAHHLYAQQASFLGARGWKKVAYRVMRRLEARGYALAQGIIAVSSTTAASLISDYGVPPERVSIIPDGVDLQVFHPFEERKIAHSVLFVGRLHRRKGLPTLVHAFAAVRRDLPDARLFIVGQGEMEAPLRRLVEQLSLSDAVCFLGRISDEGLPRWYNRAQVFALPSLLEGFGLVCLEAMACGTPVVATRVPGIVDAVTDGETGLLVPPQDSDALAQALLRLLKNTGLRHELGRRGRTEVERRFGWDQIASETASFYRRVAG